MLRSCRKRGLKIRVLAGVLRRLCQVALHYRGPSLPQNDRFSLFPPRAAGLAGRLKCKKRLLFPYRINVSAHHADKGARFAWLSPFGKHRGVPVTVSDKLS